MSASRTIDEVTMETPRTSATRTVWAGRIISGLLVLFLLPDSIIKVLRLDTAVEGTVELGYPDSVVFWVGLILLVSTILYAIPRTAILGALLLTGYLGGATATQLRLEDPWFLFPVALGVLAWAGLLLRDSRLRALVS